MNEIQDLFKVLFDTLIFYLFIFFYLNVRINNDQLCASFNKTLFIIDIHLIFKYIYFHIFIYLFIVNYLQESRFCVINQNRIITINYKVNQTTMNRTLQASDMVHTEKSCVFHEFDGKMFLITSADRTQCMLAWMLHTHVSYSIFYLRQVWHLTHSCASHDTTFKSCNIYRTRARVRKDFSKLNACLIYVNNLFQTTF